MKISIVLFAEILVGHIIRGKNILEYNISKAWFPYDRPDRPGRPDRSKQCTDDPSDYMETVTESWGTIEATGTIVNAQIELCSIRAIGTIE